MSIQSVREFVQRHQPSVSALAALGAALQARASGVPLDPALDARVQELLAALGGGDLLDGVTPQEVAPVLTMLRVTVGGDTRLLFHGATRWSYTDPALLTAAGEASMGFVPALAGVVAPTLDGLEARLEGAATFLDIGTGVGLLAIGMARRWPSLKVVGIDPWQASLALARENVQAAGLTDRIALREQAAEDLEDEAAFDLVWLPVPFMQPEAIARGAARALRAAKPGAWILAAMTPPLPDPVAGAMWRLRTTCWGGHALTPPEVAARLADAGFEVRPPIGLPGAPVVVVAGRRP